MWRGAWGGERGRKVGNGDREGTVVHVWARISDLQTRRQHSAPTTTPEEERTSTSSRISSGILPSLTSNSTSPALLSPANATSPSACASLNPAPLPFGLLSVAPLGSGQTLALTLLIGRLSTLGVGCREADREREEWERVGLGARGVRVAEEERDEYDDAEDKTTSSLSAPLFLPPPPPTSRRKPSAPAPSRSDVTLLLRPVLFESVERGEEGREAVLRDWGEVGRAMRRLIPLGEQPVMEGERGMRRVALVGAVVDGAQLREEDE